MKMRCMGLVALAMGSASTALAADMPNRQYAPAPESVYQAPLFTWTGFYAGVNAGGNWGNFAGGAGQFWGPANGAVAGVTGGYNFQSGQLVVGVEGDFDIDGARGRKVSPGPIIGFGKLTDELTVRGRVGFAADRALVYITGGYAGGFVSGSLGDATLPAYFVSEGWRSGYAVGAGIEYAFTGQMSVKAEYLFTGLAKTNVFAPPHLINAGANENAVRAGLNYHF